MTRRTIRAAAAAILLLAAPALRAQQPPPTPVSVNPPPMAPAPGCAGTGVPEAAGCKVCVVEPKKNTKTVYGSVCKEYCLPRCSLWEMIRGWCGGCSGCGECGPVRTRNVLIKKTVPACDTKQCVSKEVETCPGKAP